MTDALHVLLVGIDHYVGGRSLQGCVHDIDAVQHILLDRMKVNASTIRRLHSPLAGQPRDERVQSRLATLANIREELERLADPDVVGITDRVYIHYAGHGAQAILADDSGRRYAREALVPRDVRDGQDYRFLFDWEINDHVARIAARAHAVTMVLDCCHSAGATRSAVGHGDVRELVVQESLPLRQYVSEAPATPRGIVRALAGQVDRCQVVAACQADQKAREATLGGVRMGHLTRALCDRLAVVPDALLADLRWGEVWRGIQADVASWTEAQDPWLSGGLMRRVFGGDVDRIGDFGIGVAQKGDEYELSAGHLVGIAAGAVIGIYGMDPARFPAPGTLADANARLGTARVTRSTRATAYATPTQPIALPSGARARLLTPATNEKMKTRLVPFDLPTAEILAQSPYVELTLDRDADLLLQLEHGEWVLIDDVHGAAPSEPGFPRVPAVALDALRRVVELYVGYSTPLRAARRCLDLPGALQLAVLACDDVSLSPANAKTAPLRQLPPGHRAPFQGAPGASVCIEVENLSAQDLYFSLFDLTPDGQSLSLAHAVFLAARSRERVWNGDTLGCPITLYLPDNVAFAVDRLVALATTEHVDLRHMIQPESFWSALKPSRDRHGLMPPHPMAGDQWTGAISALCVEHQ